MSFSKAAWTCSCTDCFDNVATPADQHDEEHGSIEQRLLAGQRTLNSIRLRVSGTLLVVGIVTGILVDFTLSLADWQDLPPTGVGSHVFMFVTSAVFFGRLLIISLAPLADDVCLTRVVIWLDVAVMFFAAWSRIHAAFGCTTPCDICRALVIVGYCTWVNFSLFVIFVIGAMRHSSAVRMQADMWNALFMLYALTVLRNLASASLHLSMCWTFTFDWWVVLTGSVSLFVIRRPQLRQWLQLRLHHAFVAHSAQASAAGIAGLVGDCSVAQALAEARVRFRSLQLAQLSCQDIADNTPQPELLQIAVPTRLGSCDAFVSHSWHDDAAAKWEALQSWRCAFVGSQAREPCIWFDKCCIDQSDIEADLRCLPVFLNGCSRLVVLCGTTYLSRLWCIIELFAYVHIGGSIDRIEFRPVLRKGQEGADMGAIKDAFRSFDAAQCSCAIPEDKEKMLGIVEAAFGEVQHFNTVVQAIMDTAGLIEDSLSQGNSESELSSDQSDGSSE